MNKLKNTVLIAMLLIMIITVAKAQSSQELIGKWITTYEEGGEKAYVTYEFKSVKGKLKCYSIAIKDDSGEEGKYESLVMKKIRFKNGKGKATYMYTDEDGENYAFKANLLLKNEKTLTVSYSIMGYSDTEIWTRLN